MLGCHREIAGWKKALPWTFALAGNPNVGKSSVFNQLTGMGVVVANYPGKTVEVQLATTRFKDEEIEAKFLALASPVLGEGRARRVIDAVREAGTVKDVSELTTTLVPA